MAVILAAVACVLSLSFVSTHREQKKLVAELTASTRQQAQTTAEVLAARLDALDVDTRVLLELVGRSRAHPQGDVATERRVWAGAFSALAVVVPQYRVIALFDGDGTVEVMAHDPTEAQATVDALLPECKRVALAVAASAQKRLDRPAFRYGERSFLVYGTPVEGGGALVLASDAAIILGSGPWTSLPVARLFVTDPAGVIWAGCETPAGCRAAPPELREHLPAPPAREEIAASAASALGLSGAPAIACSRTLERATGSWSVTWVASQRGVLERQRALFWRLIVTAIAAALAVGGVAAVISRQQRQAAVLGAELRYSQALAAARQTSESIVAHAPLGVLGLAADGTVVLANRFLTDRVGEVAVGERLADAALAPGAEWLRDVAARPGQAPIETARRIATPAQDLMVRVVPVANPDLGVRLFALVEDRTELRQLEHQLVRAEKLITVGALAAGIAHEIGSPLAVIRGRAEQVLREVQSGPRAEDLQVIIRHIDRISSTIRQVLDFSRKKPIEHVPVALAPVIERARELLRLKLEHRGVTMDVALADDLPPLSADAGQLEQVLVNLVLNACDASPPGATVRVVAGRAGSGQVELEIIDEGRGIAPEHMNSVFDPFFTTKKRGEGTGLGLTIVASIVRDHGGEVRLAPGAERGTIVSLRWPAAEEETHG